MWLATLPVLFTDFVAKLQQIDRLKDLVHVQHPPDSGARP